MISTKNDKYVQKPDSIIYVGTSRKFMLFTSTFKIFYRNLKNDLKCHINESLLSKMMKTLGWVSKWGMHEAFFKDYSQVSVRFNMNCRRLQIFFPSEWLPHLLVKEA